MIETFIVGPDLDLWSPSNIKDNFILWKGNSNHHVKDVSFALKLKEKLTKYNFNIMGYPSHIIIFSTLILQKELTFI